jgi:hypothetical protein
MSNSDEATESEIDRLRRENATLRDDLFHAWAILVDWDGYWNPQTQTGDTAGLAGIITEALRVLNGEHRK